MRYTNNYNCKSPKCPFAIFLLHIHRISYSNPRSTLFQRKWSLHGYHIIVSGITRYLSSFFIMNKIYLSSLISGFRINLSHYAVWCNLNTLDIICHHILRNFREHGNFSVFTNNNLFKSICNINSPHDISLHMICIRYCV